MRSSELRDRKISTLEERMMRLEISLKRVTGSEEITDEIDGLRTPEERGVLIQFWKDVYYDGQDEQIWAAKHPAEYAALVKAIGQVPPEAVSAAMPGKGRNVA